MSGGRTLVVGDAVAAAAADADALGMLDAVVALMGRVS